MALTASALRVTLGGRSVLDGVSATFAPGQVTAVLGANGAGKSTLLRALAGLIVPDSGQVSADGRDIAAMPPRERAMAFGYLPQNGVVHWNIAARELVALGRIPHGDGGEDAIAAAMAATDTASFADRAVRTLSGGELARVLLARVLAGEPRWLLADEPLASLDPLHQLQALALLRAAADRGIGVVLVVHDLTLAARIADQVVLLKDGIVLDSGDAETVLTPEVLFQAYGVKVEFIGSGRNRAIIPVADLKI